MTTEEPENRDYLDTSIPEFLPEFISEFDTDVIQRGREATLPRRYETAYPVPRDENERQRLMLLLGRAPNTVIQLCEYASGNKTAHEQIFFERLRTVFMSGNNDEIADRVHSLTDDELQIILARNKEFLVEARERFKTEIPLLIELFFKDLSNLLRKYRLDINIEALQERFKAYGIYAIDNFHFFSVEGAEDVGGKTNEFHAQIVLPASVIMDGKELKHVLYHELCHAVAGKTASKGIANIIAIERTGIGYALERGSKSVNRFHWINEAITEDLTQETVGNLTSMSYHHELDLFILLCNRDPAIRNLFRMAYFETHDVSATSNQRLPAWRKLSHTLANMYFPGVLLVLDMYIQEYGTAYALKKMRRGELIPELKARRAARS